MSRFITIEGIDGCGKTTQIELLKKRSLKDDISMWFTSEPTTGNIGRMIRNDYLSGNIKASSKLLDSLFIADRIEHIIGDDGINTHLEKDEIVVSDRFILSGIVYSAVNILNDESNNINTLDTAVNRAILYSSIVGDLLIPDIVFIMNLTPDEARKRILSRNEKEEIYENINFQEKVYNAIHIAVNNMKCLYHKTRFIYIDASESPEKINEKIWNYIIN